MSASVQIRRAELSDLGAITEIYNEAILTTTATFDTEPKSKAEQVQWFQSHGERHPILVAVVEEVAVAQGEEGASFYRRAKVVGWVSLNKWSDRRAYDDTAEASLYVKAEYRGQGIGRKLQAAIIEEARRLGFHTLIGRVAEGSAVSLHLSKSFGFVHVGTLKEVGRKFDQLLDVHILQMMLD